MSIKYVDLRLDVCCREIANVGKADGLIRSAVTASAANRSSAELDTGILVNADHTDIIVGLVRIDSGPLIVGKGTAPTSALGDGNGRQNNDTAIVSVGGRRAQRRQVGTVG